MREGLSLLTVGVWAVFFVLFFAALKPDAVTAVAGSSKPEGCKTEWSATRQCQSHVVAAVSWTGFGQRH